MITWICKEKIHVPSHSKVLYNYYQHFWQLHTRHTTSPKSFIASHEYRRDRRLSTQADPGIHVGQLALFFVGTRLFMEISHDRCSSACANLWDHRWAFNLCHQWGAGWSPLVTIRICRACLDFIPWCKLCFWSNHAKAQLASIPLCLKSLVHTHTHASTL